MGKPIFLVKPDLITGLALDVVNLMVNGAPSDDDLASAPLLENWSVGPPRAFGLSGYVSGHPTIADGLVVTSAAYIIDSERRWLRTQSRYYRLRDGFGDP